MFVGRSIDHVPYNVGITLLVRMNGTLLRQTHSMRKE